MHKQQALESAVQPTKGEQYQDLRNYNLESQRSSAGAHCIGRDAEMDSDEDDVAAACEVAMLRLTGSVLECSQSLS